MILITQSGALGHTHNKNNNNNFLGAIAFLSLTEAPLHLGVAKAN